jgi:surfeit locus 1 family protein
MRRVAGMVLGLVVAAVCVRLGLWQLDRHAERRAWNTQAEARLAAPPVTLTSGAAPADTAGLTYRRARAVGVFGFADQVTEGNKTYQGAPGVYVVTPLRFADGTGILVNRGWAYAADGMTADLASLAELDTASVEGVLLPPSGRLATRPESLAVGYPLFPLILRRSERPDTLPAGLAPALLPARDAGPHLAYAFQWFAFAVIGVVGGMLLARRSGSGRPVSS